MEQALFRHFNQFISLSTEEFSTLIPYFHIRKLKKKTIFIREGAYANSIAFLITGSMRAYHISEGGIEQVTQLALENHWVSDLYAFLKGTPTTLTIETIEDTEFLEFYSHDMDRLYETMPKIERYFRILFQNAYVHTQQRLNAALSIPAATRYSQLIHTHPEIARRIPLHHIASYLGITPESLSRIRKKIMQ
ncbi:cyclic nucleotide-binding protein [Taibaiella sp. KBW10]|uniref:Crp/Fnr family transcriptional regulator n=1 Tax=Taibaiella sp. KBW10 TaxID=2153357 RepID=UPI000F5A266B|nr:Crp/Fnr family transcriptional regulator [Taibaiella sp. KBW10]RQO31058.1 cyclic nucleotide-binding protein [Taibaiella sp. KBW10]